MNKIYKGSFVMLGRGYKSSTISMVLGDYVPTGAPGSSFVKSG